MLELYGVLLHDDAAVPGADRLLGRLRAVGSRFVVATNDSVRSPAELSVLLTRAGLAVPAELVWTAALTAARFVATQHPDGSAFAVGSPALTEALRQVGYRVSDSAPDYVLLGDGRSYSIEAVNRAVDLVAAGARFIATTAPTTRPNRHGAVPTAAAMGALISDATGVQPYVVGKPNPLLLRGALRAIGAHAAGTVLVGTRIDVDVVAGVEAGLDTVLVDPGGWAGAGRRSRCCRHGSSARSPSSWRRSRRAVRSSSRAARRQAVTVRAGQHQTPAFGAQRHHLDTLVWRGVTNGLPALRWVPLVDVDRVAGRADARRAGRPSGARARRTRLDSAPRPRRPRRWRLWVDALAYARAEDVVRAEMTRPSMTAPLQRGHLDRVRRDLRPGSGDRDAVDPRR